VAKHQKEQAAIPGCVPAAPCRIEELFDLPGGEVFSISIFQNGSFSAFCPVFAVRKPLPRRMDASAIWTIDVFLSSFINS
jgi:hypothetical protein